MFFPLLGPLVLCALVVAMLTGPTTVVLVWFCRGCLASQDEGYVLSYLLEPPVSHV